MNFSPESSNLPSAFKAFNAWREFKSRKSTKPVNEWKRKGLPRSTWCGTKTVFDQRKVFNEPTTPKRKYIKAADKPPVAPKRKYVKAADKPPAAPKRKYVKAAEKALEISALTARLEALIASPVEELERDMADNPGAIIDHLEEHEAMKLLIGLDAE